MIVAPFKPTDEQKRVTEHPGSAFIAACPGAGKTRVMVERARKLLNGGATSGAIAFLSFTIAAVSELDDRLRRDGGAGDVEEAGPHAADADGQQQHPVQQAGRKGSPVMAQQGQQNGQRKTDGRDVGENIGDHCGHGTFPAACPA